MAEPHYEYPADLYCEGCGDWVDTRIEDRTAAYWFEEEPVEIAYRAAGCAVCGRTLCERDFDYGLIRFEHERRERLDPGVSAGGAGRDSAG